MNKKLIHFILTVLLLASVVGVLPSDAQASFSSVPISQPRAQNASKLIAIEAGHTSNSYGAASCDNVYKETDININVANLAADMLRARGYQVVVYRDDKSAFTGQTYAAYIALHVDSCTGTRPASGFKVGRYVGNPLTGLNGSNDVSDRLVQAVWGSYAEATGMKPDPITGHYTLAFRYYFGLGPTYGVSASTPAAIIEMGWMQNPELDLLLNRPQLAAMGIVNGIVNFLETNNSFSSGSPCSLPTGQFCGAFYNNSSLSGNPNFSQNMSWIDYDWGLGGPGNGIGNDNFSVRWQGSFNFDKGTYRFMLGAADGVRLWVDDILIINKWVLQGYTEYTKDVSLSNGAHLVRVEYFEGQGAAKTRLLWMKSGGCTPGNQVDKQAFFEAVARKLINPTVPTRGMAKAIKAFLVWEPKVNTAACWNPLATSLRKPGSTTFNSRGIQNYPDFETGVQATADTLNYTANGTGKYYQTIRKMMGLDAPKWSKIKDSLKVWAGNGLYSDRVIKAWKAIYR
jgi:hypothetical protein